MKWVEKKTFELYECSSGLSKSADQFGFGYPFLSYSDIFHNYFIPSELKTLVNATEKDRETCSIQRGDVFLTRTSETTEELGMSCVALRTIENATFNGFAKRLRPITDEIVPEYAAYFFRSPYFRKQCMSMASLITRASLNSGMIQHLKILYPQDKSSQEKIGGCLKNYDDLIENNNKRIKILKQMAENLYKEWFVRFRFPGHETIPIENGIPKGWKVKKIKDCVKRLPFNQTYKANELESEGKVIVVDQSADAYIGFHDNEPSHKANVESPILLFGDHSCKFVLMIKDFSLGENIVPFSSINTEWLNSYYLFYATHKIIETTEYKRHWGQFVSMKILVPSNTLQQKFSDFMKSIHKELDELFIANMNLIKQRDLLLPRLMSGKLAV